MKRSSSFILIKWIKHALVHSSERHIRANFYSTSGGICRVNILRQPFMEAKLVVLGLILVFFQISQVCDGTVSLNININKTDKEIRCQKYIIVREEMVACNMVTVIFLVLQVKYVITDIQGATVLVPTDQQYHYDHKRVTMISPKTRTRVTVSDDLQTPALEATGQGSARSGTSLTWWVKSEQYFQRTQKRL